MRDGLRTVAQLVDRIESGGLVVEDVSLSRVRGGELTADVSVTFPADGPTPAGEADRETDGGSPYGDGTLEGPGRSTREALVAVPRGDDGPGTVTANFGSLSAHVGGTAAGLIADGLAAVDRVGDGERAVGAGGTTETGAGSSSNDESFTCRVDGCEETFATEHGMKIHATKAHQAADGSAPSPHRDPGRLREVYETCETFEEMTAALDVDVTPQTVRRSMMRLGVHEPDEGGSRTTAVAGVSSAPNDDAPAAPDDQPTDPEDERDDAGTGGGGPSVDDAPDADGGPSAGEDTPVDGLLPPSVDGDEFVAAVREATTLYEVQRRLDMEREEVQTLLAEFGLLDLVHGRVATKREREDRKAEIERRIVERARGGDAGDDRERGGSSGDEPSSDDASTEDSGGSASAD